MGAKLWIAKEWRLFGLLDNGNKDEFIRRFCLFSLIKALQRYLSESPQ